ncbi:MAG: hypothetical protein HKN91_07460 [Acidimicrobiia bacterium]|nr:hypothetical protein [Acidimicrobiia bacterium]
MTDHYATPPAPAAGVDYGANNYRRSSQQNGAPTQYAAKRPLPQEVRIQGLFWTVFWAIICASITLVAMTVLFSGALLAFLAEL